MSDDRHFIDDPLMVVNAKPDFSGLGIEPKHKQKKKNYDKQRDNRPLG